MNLFKPPSSYKYQEENIAGASYLQTLHKYLSLNLSRLAPPLTSKTPQDATILQQSYTILTLGLDPASAPLSRNLKVPLTLGFGTPQAPRATPQKPLLLRLPPDRLLYLLLRWQSLPQSLPHVGRTDVGIEAGVPVAARGARYDERNRRDDGDVRSVRSWVGSMRSVSMGSKGGMGWWRKKEEINEDQILLSLYSVFTVLPALLIHPPFLSDPPIAELVDAGGYTQLGGIDVRVPLDVLRNLQVLELEAYDPRGLLIPPNPALRSLTVRDVQDGDEWLEELLVVLPEPSDSPVLTPNPQPASPDLSSQYQLGTNPPRFPNLKHLSLHTTSLLSFPTVSLPHLTSLDLSHNLLNDLPPSLSSLSSLQSLNLSNNLITSVRNAPSVLGNITALNLSHNRIDCLIGLERVRGLERIDVRSNELVEWDEVGRLSVLPMLKEVWCCSNPFDQQDRDEEWRVNLGVCFAVDGKEGVVVDDRPWSWNESRRIELALQARGIDRNRSTTPSNATRRQTQPTVVSSTLTEPPREHFHPQPSQDHHEPGDGSASPRVSGEQFRVKSPGPGGKKRKPRRIIDLDDDNNT